MRRRWLLLTATAYGLVLATVGLWPTPVDRNVTVVQWGPVAWMGDVLSLDVSQTYHLVEFSANVALFAPLGALVMLWRPRWRWIQAVGLAFSVTATIEVLQQVLRPERFSSLSDVAANTIGGALGALIVIVFRRSVIDPVGHCGH